MPPKWTLEELNRTLLNLRWREDDDHEATLAEVAAAVDAIGDALTALLVHLVGEEEAAKNGTR